MCLLFILEAIVEHVRLDLIRNKLIGVFQTSNLENGSDLTDTDDRMSK